MDETIARPSAITSPDPSPDERPQRRREYSGPASTLGVAALLVIVVGVAIWWFELRGEDGGSATSGDFGIIDLPEALNPTGRDPAAEPGRAAPDFELAVVDSTGTARLSDFRGKTVLVNFWASWCGPCRQETPALQRLYEANSAEGLVVLGVNQQERPDTAGSFIRQFDVTYPVVLDRDGEVNAAYRVGRGLPISVLIGPDGVVRRVFFGQLDDGMLAAVASCAAGQQTACTPGAG